MSILDAAIPLFASVGYDKTRMSDVAANVGVTEPVIFQNFGTKAELFSAVLERVADQAAASLSDLAAEHANVCDWLAELLSPEHLERLHTSPMFGVVFADAHRLQFDPDVSAALQRSIALVAEAMAAIVRRGQAEGAVRADVPPLTLAWLVVSLIQARQFRRTYTPEPSRTLETDLLGRTLDLLRAGTAHGTVSHLPHATSLN